MLKTCLMYLFLCNTEDTVYGYSSWISYWLAKNFVPVLHTILWKNQNKLFGQPNTWKFAYSLKFIQNPEVNHNSRFSVIWRHRIINSGEELGIWWFIPRLWGWTKWHLPSCLSSPAANKCLSGYLVPSFLHFCAFC